ncbi:MAG: type II secretion system protein [Kiritimatiellae bacterium]|nr:type II secretion system protein [Kiritimatiellia bacterium]
MKRGFTIIELLMVISILAVLLGIVTTAATASIRQSRDRQAQAMKQTLQNGIAAYRVRKDKWPEKLEKWADQEHDGTIGYLSKGDYDKVIQEILRVSTGRNAKNRVMDPVGLAVIPASESDGKIGCMDFRSVTTKNNKHAKRMEYNEMTVVYPKTDTGRAYRYVIEYNAESDEVTVMTQGDYASKTGDNWTGSEVWR